jgi:hypothetical protein
MALASAASDGTPRVQTLFDGLTSVSQLGRKDDLASGVVDHCYASSVASWIKLETERCELGMLDCHFQDDRERVPFEDGRFA